MAQVFTTGPVSIHATPGGSSLFIGHSEQGARITIKPAHDQVMTDLAGTRLPHDVAYMGAEAFVSVTLTRWNEENRQALCAYGNPAGGTEGIDEQFDRGALFIHEELSYNLLCVFPKQAQAKYSTLRPGYRFLEAWLEGATEIDAGTKPLKISLVWHCIGRYDPSTGRFTLADFNVSGAATID